MTTLAQTILSDFHRAVQFNNATMALALSDIFLQLDTAKKNGLTVSDDQVVDLLHQAVLARQLEIASAAEIDVLIEQYGLEIAFIARYLPQPVPVEIQDQPFIFYHAVQHLLA